MMMIISKGEAGKGCNPSQKFLIIRTSTNESNCEDKLESINLVQMYDGHKIIFFSKAKYQLFSTMEYATSVPSFLHPTHSRYLNPPILLYLC